MQFEIIVGSMLGASEYVADALSEYLSEKGHPHQIHLQPDVQALDPDGIWIICSSTHGAGDLPDNIQSFATQLADLNGNDIRYLVIGLGDSSYDTFCEAAKTLHNKMQQTGANILSAPYFIDVLTHPMPEENALDWFADWLSTAQQIKVTQ